MKNAIINAKVIFYKGASESFNFPIIKPIRISFWLKGDKGSIFSEINSKDEMFSWNIPYNVKIKLVETNLLKNRLKKGADFLFGIFPNAIGKGKIIEVKSFI